MSCYIDKLIETINKRRNIDECVCPICKNIVSMKYKSSRSSYLEEWYRCSQCFNTHQPSYLGAWNKLHHIDRMENLK